MSVSPCCSLLPASLPVVGGRSVHLNAQLSRAAVLTELGHLLIGLLYCPSIQAQRENRFNDGKYVQFRFSRWPYALFSLA